MNITKQHPLISKFRETRNHILDILFPKSCFGCGYEGEWLCSTCLKKLNFNSQNNCLKCNKNTHFSEFCKDCSPFFSLDGVWVSGDYNNPLLASLIKNLKYNFIKEIKIVLGQFVSNYLRNYLQQISLTRNNLGNGMSWRDLDNIKKAPAILFSFNESIIIPVPLSKARKRWRSFNQAYEIAEQVADTFCLELNCKLRRIKHKKPQAKLGKTMRRENIKNCFVWQGHDLSRKNIILVDDVATTGSTLNECARILKKNNAQSVWGLVVAHG